MIAVLKEKISHTSFTPTDAAKTLRSVATYAWIGSGALFLCYSYFVGAITFSVIKQQSLEHSIRGTVSAMSTQELSYLANQKDLTLARAQSLGLTQSPAVAFAPTARAFAWNVGY